MKLKRIMRFPSIINQVFTDLFSMILIFLPGVTGIHIRRMVYKKKFRSCGKNLIVDVGVIIEGFEFISIGDNVTIDRFTQISTTTDITGDVKIEKNHFYKGDVAGLSIGSGVHIAQFCYIAAHAGIEIGDNCGFSSGVKIYSLTNVPNDHKDKSKIISIMPLGNPYAPYLFGPIVFGSNVWIALDSIILPGTYVGNNSFAVSNSLLMGDFPENAYIVGQPAKMIKNRFDIKSDDI